MWEERRYDPNKPLMRVRVYYKGSRLKKAEIKIAKGVYVLYKDLTYIYSFPQNRLLIMSLSIVEKNKIQKASRCGFRR